MDPAIRKLIEDLGEAIHDSVAESEQIAGVVEKIREHGFEVLLMLEASIGLHEVTSEEEEEGAEAQAEGESSGEFTAQDMHFLRSLRIAVEGEEPEG